MRRYFMSEVKPHLSYEGQINMLREKDPFLHLFPLSNGSI